MGYGNPADGQDYIDRSVIDFDPTDGLLSGTAITGRGRHPSVDLDAAQPTPSPAQRAAERDVATDTVGQDAFGVRRHPSPEQADIAAGNEIGRGASR